MTENQEQKSKDMTLKSLEKKLRHLPEIEVPEALEARLLAAIPDRRTKGKQAQQLQWRRAWDFGVTAAAAVLIFALMFLVNYGLSISPQTSITEFDTSLCYTRWDQNNFLYDQNNMYVEKSVPNELK
ncbi:MAG TPA: hypothetical protein VMY06_02525 [Sedimentisphaerales bacterium]|nr:hypothetical protein [Sedimentisphaerales bacterium]